MTRLNDQRRMWKYIIFSLLTFGIYGIYLEWTMINDMNIKDKLRLAICMSQSKWSGLIYNTKENYEKFDAMLKEVDEEYRTTLINFAKYKLVMFAMAKIMEMDKTEQNKVSLYLFNIIR